MPLAKDGWSEGAQVLAGDRLRRTRIQQRLSIRQIAELSKVSKTTILQVESGKSSRKSTYLKVAEALGLHLDRLLWPDTSGELPYSLHRKSDDTWFDLANFGEGPLPDEAQRSPFEREKLVHGAGVSPLNILLSRLEHGRIKPTVLELFAPSPVRSHAGEEFVYVLSGDAIVSVGGKELNLSEGESMTFWSSEPHAYAPQENSSLPVKILSVRVDS